MKVRLRIDRARLRARLIKEAAARRELGGLGQMYVCETHTRA